MSNVARAARPSFWRISDKFRPAWSVLPAWSTIRKFIFKKSGTSAGVRSVARTVSPLIFPSKADYSKLHRYRVLDSAEEQVWDSLFEPIYQS